MNKMLDSLFCECGGKYQHIDQEQGDDGIVDTYQCDSCQTWCLILSEPETERELKREYSTDDDAGPLGTEEDFHVENAVSEDLALGPCCACGETGPDVRNIMMLNRLCPTPGKGWGCLQCGLPMDYATAVLCDACMEGPYGTGPVPLKFVCTGYPAKDGRTPIEQAPEVKVKHNPLYHPEMLQEIKWFDQSPDYGHPECTCSICDDPIPDLDDLPEDFSPLRLYRKPSVKHPHGQEARFCPDCLPVVLKYMQWRENA